MYPIRINDTEISDADEFTEYMNGKTLSKEGRRDMESESCNTALLVLLDSADAGDLELGMLCRPYIDIHDPDVIFSEI